MTTKLASPSTNISRDRWGRPLIEPIGGGKPEPYTRVSTLAKVLDDKTALTKWKQRMTALGIGLRPDLAQLAGVAKDDNKRLDDVVKQAMAAAETTRAANIGTTLHALTEYLDRGLMPESIPDNAWPDLTAYENSMQGIEILGCEMFVVVDEIKAAGTFDRLVRLPDGRVMVADIKTGQHEPKYPHGATTQIAIYSRGITYTPEKGRHHALADLGVSQTEGMMIHLPAGQQKCDLYIVDLNIGWSLATVAAQVRKMQKVKPLTPYAPE